MDVKRIKFLLAIQEKIDQATAQLGYSHPDIIKVKEKFNELAGTELNGKRRESNGNSYDLSELKIDTTAIRGHLEIRAEHSIDYSFIKTDRVKNQLYKDNLRMENIRLDHTIKNENERLHAFCVNAFYQIEELLNYYYNEKYTFKRLLAIIAPISKQNYSRAKNISHITLNDKITHFEKTFLIQYDPLGQPYPYTPIMRLLKDIRNIESHRCSVIEKDTDQILKKHKELLSKIENFNSKNPTRYRMQAIDYEIENAARLIHFIRSKDYNQIRQAIQDFSLIIRDELS